MICVLHTLFCSSFLCHKFLQVSLCLLNLMIWSNIKRQKNKFRSTKKSYSSTVIKLILVVFFNVACFLSSICFHVVSVHFVEHLDHLTAWNTLLIFSVPAMCNPFFFMRLSRRNPRNILSTVWKLYLGKENKWLLPKYSNLSWQYILFCPLKHEYQRLDTWLQLSS